MNNFKRPEFEVSVYKIKNLKKKNASKHKTQKQTNQRKIKSSKKMNFNYPITKPEEASLSEKTPHSPSPVSKGGLARETEGTGGRGHNVLSRFEKQTPAQRCKLTKHKTTQWSLKKQLQARQTKLLPMFILSF